MFKIDCLKFKGKVYFVS